MHSGGVLLLVASVAAGFCLVHLEVPPPPAFNGALNETTTTSTLKNSTSNTLINITSNASSNTTTTTNHQLTQPSAGPPNNQTKTSDEDLEFDRFKSSVYYLAPFEDGLKSIPKPHKEYIDHVVDKDLNLFFEILDEAIEKRNKFAPSVHLMWKYASKLVTNCIKNRQGELRVEPRKEMSAAFFNMVADLMEKALKLSKEVRQERGYTKKSVDVADFGTRVRKALNYVAQTIHSSPLAVYLKWDQLQLYKNEPNPKGVLEESSDLVAIFSAMGYDNCLFVARRIVNLLRLFSKGQVPSESEV